MTARDKFSAEDFSEEHSDKFLRRVFYWTIFNAKARDWVNQDVRIGFDREDNELNEGFKPQWHHVFPRRLLRGRFDDAKTDSLANIAVLNERANRSLSAKPPREYLQQHRVNSDRLAEQAIPSEQLLEIDRFDEFLAERAKLLAKKSGEFLERLT